MNIKHKDPIVDEKEPFLNCKLERKQYADVLTNIVEHYADGFVMAINNEWGTGKTTFVKMWKQQLENEGFKTLYFNAWENDFEDNVLIALISELDELKEPKTEKAFKTVLEKAAPLSKKLFAGVGKALAKKLAGEEGEEIAKSLIEGTFEVGADEMEEGIKAYAKQKKSIEDFKNNLEAFVSETGEDRPIVFIIDELDRCRPNYAVEVLEKMKHMFSVPGIVFVLSIDKTQLSHAIKGAYGSDKIDSIEYLRRFIDIEYSIPIPNTELFCNYLFEYYQFDDFLRVENRRTNRNFTDDSINFIEYTTYLFDKVNATLRHQEKIFANARLAINSFKENQFVFPRLFILLIFIKQFHFQLYKKILTRNINPQELINLVEEILPKNQNETENRLSIFSIAYLSRFYSNWYREKHHDYNIYRTDLDTGDKNLVLISSLDNSDEMVIFKEVHKIIERDINNANLKLNYLLDRINLIEPFIN